LIQINAIDLIGVPSAMVGEEMDHKE